MNLTWEEEGVGNKRLDRNLKIRKEVVGITLICQTWRWICKREAKAASGLNTASKWSKERLDFN